jgi:hypothetical protein
MPDRTSPPLTRRKVLRTEIAIFQFQRPLIRNDFRVVCGPGFPAWQLGCQTKKPRHGHIFKDRFRPSARTPIAAATRALPILSRRWPNLAEVRSPGLSRLEFLPVASAGRSRYDERPPGITHSIEGGKMARCVLSSTLATQPRRALPDTLGPPPPRMRDSDASVDVDRREQALLFELT